MKKNQLLNYLETVIDLEKTILTNQNIIEEMDYKVSMLGIPRNFIEPTQPQEPTYEKEPEIKEYKNKYYGTKDGVKKLLMGVCGFALFLLLGGVLIPMLAGLVGILGTIVLVIFTLFLLIYILYLLFNGISGIFSTVRGVVKDVSSNKKENERVSIDNQKALERVRNTNEKKLKEYNENYSRYKKDYSEYLNNVKADKERVATEKYQITAINWQKGLVEEALKKTNETLEKYYSLDILKPKYRNLAYAAQIYDYLYNGLCENLEGTHNAYYILEEELRMQHIIDRIDVVIANLERIEANQSKLYSVVSSVNQTTLRISDSISKFAHSYSRQNDLLIKGNERLINTLQNNQQQLNTKIDEATRNLQNSLAVEHKNSELGLYLSEQSQKDLDYIASYIQYKDDRIGATRV